MRAREAAIPLLKAEVLPNLIVIGGAKCGTTALHHYLDLHPQVAMSRHKELNFFIDRESRPPTIEAPRGGEWHRGVDWYRGQFPDGVEVRGEATPGYTNHPAYPRVPERMASVVPDARLIYMVRDPIERLVSHYLHMYAVGTEGRPLSEVVADNDFDNDYVWQSRYHAQLARYLPHYPRERILVLTQEELLTERRATLARAFRFLGVREDFTSPRFELAHHVTASKRRKGRLGISVARPTRRLPPKIGWRVRKLLTYPLSRPLPPRPELEEPIRARLAERLAPEVDALRDLCGSDFERWSL